VELVHNRLRNDNRAIRFHEVVDGEILVADESVVLEMVLDDSVGMIIYDRGKHLAAASKLCLRPPGGRCTSIRERTSSTSLALLARLASLGCSPERLEIFALGALDGVTLGTRPGDGRLRHVAFAMGLPRQREARRVEFDVALGRIVVEECCPSRI
jgi:hypothetical protein